jgi:hypothetical protein
MYYGVEYTSKFTDTIVTLCDPPLNKDEAEQEVKNLKELGCRNVKIIPLEELSMGCYTNNNSEFDDDNLAFVEGDFSS